MKGLEIAAAGPRHDRVLFAIAFGRLALQLTAISNYGWFRDELYYVACASHLDWGYVDQPPLSLAVLAVWRHLVGDGLVAMRILPALVGAIAVFVAGRVARELGGGRFAQALTATAAALAPVFLGMSHYYSMNVFDILAWSLAGLILIRALRTGEAHHWVALGGVLGLGLLNKISLLWFGAGLAVGLVLTPHRRVLATPGPYLAALIAGALFLPHVLWQIQHDWPTLEFIRNATGRKMVAIRPLEFLLRQVLVMGPANAPLWIGGLLVALWGGTLKAWRILALLWLTVLVILLAGGKARAEYLTVAMPMALALGAVAFERATASPGWRRLRPVSLALIVLLGLPIVPLAIPVLPVETFARYQNALGMAPSTDEKMTLAELPQHYADMFGWPEMVDLVAQAYARLTPEERRHCVVFGQNYGEAGAVDALGRRRGLPHAISGHNSYWLWGPGDSTNTVVIVIGGDRPDNAAVFDSLEIVGQTRARWAIPYEQELDVSIGRGLKQPIGKLWLRLKHFI